MQKDFEGLCQEKVNELMRSLHRIENERAKTYQTLNNICKTQERMQQEPNPSAYYKNKLLSQLKAAMGETEEEELRVRESLALIQEIRQLKNEKRIAARTLGYNKETIRRGALMKILQQSALTLPLFISSNKEPPPPLCGAVPAELNYIAKVGDMVAALVKSQEGDENWILAEVLGFNHTANKYEILDIDEEQREKHMLCRRRVVSLPLMRANPDMNPEALFSKETLVMALYPQTTCFYRAVIHCGPKTPLDDYEVLFEDTTYPEGYSPPLVVAQRYVIAFKETRKK